MNDLLSGSSASALTLVLLALVPLALMTLTSFAKISVVLSALRNALGAPDLPSGALVTALALALSAYVMAPLARDVEQAIRDDKSRGTQPALYHLFESVRTPLANFLEKNAGKQEKNLLLELAQERGETLRGDELSVLWAAFTLHEMKQAFYLAFFVYLPFLVVDLLVASVLLALGLSALTPQVVALPFKLMLFVAADGFVLISRALVLSYK